MKITEYPLKLETNVIQSVQVIGTDILGCGIMQTEGGEHVTIWIRANEPKQTQRTATFIIFATGETDPVNEHGAMRLVGNVINSKNQAYHIFLESLV